MVKYKLNVADPKEGKTTSVEVDEPESLTLLNRKIGDVVNGGALGLQWEKLRISGGSDNSGIPMRSEVHGGVKKRVLLSSGVGMKDIKRKGFRKRKVIRGNTITRDTYQINMVMVEEKPKKVEEKPKKVEEKPKKSKSKKSS
ncbi:MAG: 30S ribosomal protein S6e [Nitrososphaeria archaeon]|nr:30S ribosomal protein S6e [Nitrososphaeria archaeon]NIN52102.1 30S ribosomal protein S6e [Nitrososphaeria archaeon]NIQ32564.1 30S ribosomal protein S6e [Nitrososphaeria archaeon]